MKTLTLVTPPIRKDYRISDAVFVDLSEKSCPIKFRGSLYTYVDSNGDDWVKYELATPIELILPFGVSNSEDLPELRAGLYVSDISA